MILYELLTGTTPITRESMKKAALDEMLKLIREQDAPTPSSRLSTSESKPSIAANRQMEPQKLGRFIKGELDWIVMKALSKERDRRYETATGFARDVERFLNNEAVAAGPPSTSYRLRKFVKRNRGQVIAASSDSARASGRPRGNRVRVDAGRASAARCRAGCRGRSDLPSKRPRPDARRPKRNNGVPRRVKSWPVSGLCRSKPKRRRPKRRRRSPSR